MQASINNNLIIITILYDISDNYYLYHIII